MLPNPFLVKINNFYRGKIMTKNVGSFSIFQKNAQRKQSPYGTQSPNLVTL
jgi:hypothetical protein